MSTDSLTTPLLPARRNDEAMYGVTRTYSNPFAYCMGINYVIGTGVFALPHAFWTSGLLLMGLTILIGAVASMLCAYYTLEVLARAEGIQSLKEQSNIPDDDESSELKVNSESTPPAHRITYRKFDFTILSRVFGGFKTKLFTQTTMTFYCWGAMWAYVAVFAGSIVTVFFNYVLDGEDCDISDSDASDSCKRSYYIAVAVYACIVVPLTLLDVAEQMYVQAALTVYRFSSFIVMIITVCIAMAHQPALVREQAKEDYGFKFSGFVAAFTSSIVALNFHYNMPDVIQPVRDKKRLRLVISASLITATTFYIVIGSLCAIYFGENTNEIITKNWSAYTGCGDGWEKCSSSGRSAKAIVVQLWVLLFPICDMVSVYPLIGITLSNNLMEMVPASMKLRYSPRVLRIATRLGSTIIPLILGAAVGSLSTIFEFAGLFAFFLEFLIPCGLHIVSTQLCRKTWGHGSERTEYSGWYSRLGITWTIIVFSSMALLFSIVAKIRPSLFE
eukprot:Opistho-2@51389